MQTVERRFHIPHWYQMRREEHMAQDNVLIEKLVRKGIEMSDRTTTYTAESDRTFPAPIDEALEVVHNRFAIVTPFDTAKLKRYEHESAAFMWHADPKRI
ncbi:MAG: hypothetical protein H0W89_03520 [Candidatus Levybacteria bacterium]|nr:hypothetical protein [Candidatus Levybacteria bacterium]